MFGYACVCFAVWVCMCVYVYIHMSICMHVCVCVCVYIYICVDVCECVHMEDTSAYMFMYVKTGIDLRISMHTHAANIQRLIRYVRAYVCIHTIHAYTGGSTRVVKVN
jgi:hypothetical protein